MRLKAGELCSAADFAALPEDWRGEYLWVDSAVLDSNPDCEKLRKFTAEKVRVIIHDLASPAMTRLIPAEDRKLQLEFQSFLLKRCEKLLSLGIREFSLSCDWERAAANPEFCVQLKKLLRSCFGILEYNHLTLWLNICLPADERWLVQFQQDLLYPHVKLVFWEPESSEKPEF